MTRKQCLKEGEFKYEFHQKVYVEWMMVLSSKKEFLGRQNGESELQEYRNRLKNMQFQKRDALFAEEINFFQDAYCISVHKSQGSEWNNVLIFDEESNIF